MKRNPGYLAREVAGRFVLAPVGETVKSFSGMITMNATGKLLWELLEQEQSVESLAAALSEKYEVALDVVTADVVKYLEPLKEIGAVTD